MLQMWMFAVQNIILIIPFIFWLNKCSLDCDVKLEKMTLK